MYLENRAKSVKAKLINKTFMIVIYKAQNKINGKIYIGKTNNLPKRIREHTRYDVNNNLMFHKAIKSYGEENFEWEVIDQTDDLQKANELESYYIKKYNSFKPNGYNMTFGGDGGNAHNAVPIVCLTLLMENLSKDITAPQKRKEKMVLRIQPSLIVAKESR